MKAIKNVNTFKKNFSISPQILYFICSITGILLFFIAAFKKGPAILQWAAMENNSDWAMLDYFRQIFYCIDRNTVYDTDAVFPPLAYVFYYILRKMTLAPEPDISDMNAIPPMPYQMMVFILYSVAGTGILIYAVNELKIKGWQKSLLSFSILFSVPMFTGALERGNLLLYVVDLLLLAAVWKDSKNPVQRECALIFIAAAAGLKIYPAFFGILYLKEKRYKEAGRLIVYGIIMIFLPFIFFGGFQGFLKFLDAITSKMEVSYPDRVQFFTGLIGMLGITGRSAQYLSYLFLTVLLTLTLCTKSNIRKMTYLAAAMAFFPAGAYRYTLLYFLMPLFVLFAEQEKRNVDSYVNAALLGLLFSIPTVFGIATGFRLAYGGYTYTYVEKYIYTIAWGYLFYQIAIDIVQFFAARISSGKKMLSTTSS